MDIDEFAELVRTMRQAQVAYFRTRTTAALEESKRLERAVDQAIKHILSPNHTLFDEDYQ